MRMKKIYTVNNYPKKHFKGKNNGYYYITYFDQKLNKRFTLFWTIPVSVILTNNSENQNSNISSTILLISIFISIAIFILIIGIVIYICFIKNKNKDLKEEVLKTSFKEELREM